MIGLVFLLICMGFYRNTGICFSEGRLLTEHELADLGFIENPTWQKLTPAERETKIKENREKYPDCCRPCRKRRVDWGG